MGQQDKPAAAPSESKDKEAFSEAGAGVETGAEEGGDFELNMLEGGTSNRGSVRNSQRGGAEDIRSNISNVAKSQRSMGAASKRSKPSQKSSSKDAQQLNAIKMA